MHETFHTRRPTTRAEAMRAMLLVIVALGGCGSDGGGEDAETQGPSISPILDTERESSASVGSAGGVVTATGADGTEYMLSIPADALIEETEISLTPVVSIDDLPMSGGFVAGVHFEPSGLELFRTATLRVTMPSAPGLGDGEELAGFVYEGDGENLALALAEIDGSSFSLPIHHFSGAGSGAANPTELEAQFAPGSADAFIAQLLQAQSSADVAAIDAIIESWYEARVRSSLQAAVSNDEALDRALAERARWLAAAEYYGSTELIDGLVTDSENLAGDAFREAVARANDLCERNESFEEAEKALVWQRRAESVLPEDELFAEGLDRQSVLADLCVQVVIESTSFPQSPVAGEPALLEVVFGFAFGDGPTEFSNGMVAFVLATGAAPAGATELTDENGRAEVTLTPDSASVSIEVNACIGTGGFNGGQLVAGLVCQEVFIVRGLVIDPNQAVVRPGGTVSFDALLSGASANVVWTATGGTIDQNGLYAAGSEEGRFQVTATSVDDSTLTATATVTIEESTTTECFVGFYVGTFSQTIDGVEETFGASAQIDTCNPQREAFRFRFGFGANVWDNRNETMMGTPDDFFGSLTYSLNGTVLEIFNLTEVRGSATADTLTFTALCPGSGQCPSSGFSKTPIEFTGTCNTQPSCGIRVQ